MFLSLSAMLHGLFLFNILSINKACLIHKKLYQFCFNVCGFKESPQLYFLSVVFADFFKPQLCLVGSKLMHLVSEPILT
jgi:hypothetical protein